MEASPKEGNSTSSASAIKRVMYVAVLTFLVGLMQRQQQTEGSLANIRISSLLHPLLKRSAHSDIIQSQSPIRITVPDPPLQTSRMPSHYEQLWPGHHLPEWSKKSFNYEVPRNESTCFIHVGKAGGSAVGCSLGFSLHCGGSTQIEGVLPKVTTTVFHKDIYNCDDDSEHFLFIIRDPIDRARSAFNYDRPGAYPGFTKRRYRHFYNSCSFGTLEEMVQDGLSTYGNSSEHCQGLAYRAIRGIEWVAPSHFYYNYQYYFESVPEQSKIIVIRNEYIKEDWNALEEKMSGRNDIMNDESMPTVNANKQMNEEDLYISDESLEILCEALCNEIQIYKKILRLAQNLNKAQVEESLDALALKCPVEARKDSCPEAMPDIKRKLKMNRGYGKEEDME